MGFQVSSPPSCPPRFVIHRANFEKQFIIVRSRHYRKSPTFTTSPCWGFPSHRCCEAAGGVLCTFTRSFGPLDLCGTFAARNCQVLIVIMLSSRLGTMFVSYLKWLGLPTDIRFASRFVGLSGTASPRGRHVTLRIPSWGARFSSML